MFAIFILPIYKQVNAFSIYYNTCFRNPYTFSPIHNTFYNITKMCTKVLQKKRKAHSLSTDSESHMKALW